MENNARTRRETERVPPAFASAGVQKSIGKIRFCFYSISSEIHRELKVAGVKMYLVFVFKILVTVPYLMAHTTYLPPKHALKHERSTVSCV
jgi:hypothetical protein